METFEENGNWKSDTGTAVTSNVINSEAQKHFLFP
jgi:hypothetical protein